MNWKVFLLLIVFPFVGLISFEESKPFTVVIDAGHGGKDPGALGSKSFEKDVALAVALKLGEFVKDSLPEVETQES